MSSDATTDTFRFDNLKAVYINCTLKKSPEVSNTQGLENGRLAR